MCTADRKKWRISALEILSLCSSVEDSLLECLRANISKRSPTFDLVSKPRSGKYLQFRKKSLFTTVLITNNGRLDQRAWFKKEILEVLRLFWKWCPHVALSYHGYTIPPIPKDTTCTATSVGRSTRLVYRFWCSTAGLHTRPFKATAKRKSKLARKFCVVCFH